MGAPTSNRKRTDECFNLHTQSPLLNYDNNHHVSKKPRLLYTETLIPTRISRLSRYPSPEKLSRAVHAPCRSAKLGFLSKREDTRVRENILFDDYNRLRINALNSFLIVNHEKEKEKEEVIDLEADSNEDVRVSKVDDCLEDGNEVRSVVSDDDCGDGFESEIRKMDGEGVENGGLNKGSSRMSELIRIDDARKALSSVSLGREAYKELLYTVDKTYAPKLSSLDFEIRSTKAQLLSIRLEKPKEEKKPADLEEPLKDVLHEPFVPLTEQEERDVARALSRSNRRKVLVTHENSNIEITGEILQCLRPGAWLNDEVINLYLELLKERERREPKKYLNCHFFNTFFYKKLIGGRNGYDYKAVRRWTTQRKLGYGLVDCDKIFVPIHKEVHWCLAVINKRDKSLQYLDSLGGRDRQVLRVLARYFMDEVKDKSQQEIDVNSWSQEFVEDLPEQQNGYDCGVFMIKYVDFYSRGLGLHFSQEHMPYFRLRTAKEILRLRAD